MLYSKERGEVKLQQTYLVELVVREPNSPLVQQLREKGIEVLAPILGEIIAEGVEEGFFDTEYPEEAAEFLIRGAEGKIRNDLGDADAMIRTYTMTLDMWERVLGAKKGTFMSLMAEHEEDIRKFAVAAERIDNRSDITQDGGDD